MERIGQSIGRELIGVGLILRGVYPLQIMGFDCLTELFRWECVD